MVLLKTPLKLHIWLDIKYQYFDMAVLDLHWTAVFGERYKHYFIFLINLYAAFSQ